MQHDGGRSDLWNVTRFDQLDALAAIFAAPDAEAVLVIEAPDTLRDRDGARALMHFAEHAGAAPAAR